MSRYRHVESLPLMNNNPSALDDPNMTDEELDDLMQTPLALEGILEHMRYHPHTITKQQYYKGALFFSLLSLVFGVIVSFVSCGFLCDSRHPFEDPRHDFEEASITSKIMNYTNENSIKIFLRNLTSTPLLAGSPADKQSAHYVYSVWKDQGLDVKNRSYKVLLSYPDADKPNKISLISKVDKSTLFSTLPLEKPLYTKEENRSDVSLPFLAYSASTNEPLIGDLIYANYGRREDFQKFISEGVNLTGTIAIIRYGKIYRGNKVKTAESYGVKGVILYCDPIDYAPKGPANVYPTSEYLPPSGVQRGSLLVEDGDPTTPFYPSIERSYRIPQGKMNLPKIPAHVISYNDAAELLKILKGPHAPLDWTGGLNLEYHLGPGFLNDSVKLQMEVNTKNVYKTTYNVIGMIHGKDEPDRFVLVGNHRDAWTFGGTDPSSGTAAMLEMSRVFGKLLKQGWKPRRSIVFCSWGAEEYGLIGSTEWVEENQKKLVSQAVAYLNVDISVTGNHTLLIRSVPLLHQVFLEAAKKVPNPNPEEIHQGRMLLYDTWLQYSKNKLLPKIEDIGAGSDFAPFIHTIGVSSADLTFTCKEDLVDCYPVYHTLYDTFHLQEKILDQGFHFNKALTQLWAEATRHIADSPVLPFSVMDLSSALNKSLIHFQEVHQEHLNHCKLSLTAVRKAVDQFSIAARKFENSLKKLDYLNSLAVRRVNDALMHLERAFIDYQGLPLRKNYRHVLFAPDANDAYNGSIFGGLLDIFYEMDLKETSLPDDLQSKAAQHISVIAFHIHAAKGIMENTF